MIRNKVDAKVVMELKGHTFNNSNQLAMCKVESKKNLNMWSEKNQIKHIGWEKYNNEKKTFTCLYAKYDRAEKRQ